MSRLRTRCFVVSAGAHALLALLLLAGSGFLRAKRPVESLPLLTFVPDRLVDAMVVGGGSPQGSQTPAALVAMPPPAPLLARPLAPAPSKPPAARPPKAAPEKEPSRMDLTEPKPGKRSPVRRRDVEVNLKPTVRKTSDQGDDQTAAETAAWVRQAAAAHRARVTGAVTTLEGKLSSGSLSAVPLGPGGESYANYGVFVLSVYDWAWQPPAEIADEGATVKVKVVIAREGKVISSEILSKSGIAALDKSVREALGRVDDIGKSFPEGAKEDQRVFIINFNLKARHRLG